MDTAGSGDHIDEFTLELLRVGLMLSGVTEDLIEALPPGAYPGEEPGAVVLEMVTGTIRTALVGADRADVERATELIVEAKERVLEHLQLALQLSRRMRSEADDQPLRRYG